MLFSTIIGSVFSLLGVVNGRKRSNNELAKRDSWGAAWSTGPCQTGNSLKYVSYNFSPGKPPNPGKDALFLWLGISNGTGDLIQAGVDDYASNSWCGATASQWCAEASIFGSFGQLNGASGVVNADETIKVVYQRNSDKSGWVQNVYDGSGNLFSTLSSSSGPMTGLGTGTECNENCAGSVDYQYYTNLEFIFEEADPNYSQTLGVGTGVSHTPLTSSDGGITWTVSQIIIPPMIAGATTRTTSTTKSTGTTTTRSTTTTTTGSGSCAAHYAQCGGIGYTGATTCCSGYTCTYSNAYYSQCL